MIFFWILFVALDLKTHENENENEFTNDIYSDLPSPDVVAAQGALVSVGSSYVTYIDKKGQVRDENMKTRRIVWFFFAFLFVILLVFLSFSILFSKQFVEKYVVFVHRCMLHDEIEKRKTNSKTNIDFDLLFIFSYWIFSPSAETLNPAVVQDLNANMFI